MDSCNDASEETPNFPHLQLCSDRIDSYGVYLMDKPDLILVYVCRSVSAHFCQAVLGVNGYAALMGMVGTLFILSAFAQIYFYQLKCILSFCYSLNSPN